MDADYSMETWLLAQEIYLAAVSRRMVDDAQAIVKEDMKVLAEQSMDAALVFMHANPIPPSTVNTENVQ